MYNLPVAGYTLLSMDDIHAFGVIEMRIGVILSLSGICPFPLPCLAFQVTAFLFYVSIYKSPAVWYNVLYSREERRKDCHMSLLPDRIFGTYQEITVDFLKSEGIEAVILDVDNTLIPYEEIEPRPAVLAWINTLIEANIAISFVTNNHKHRLQYFNRNLNFPAFHDSWKPFSRNMKRAMRAMGSTPENTANIGDQIFTDTWAGKRLGMKSYLLPPIRDKRDPFTRLKRLLEKPIVRRYYAAQKEQEQKE